MMMSMSEMASSSAVCIRFQCMSSSRLDMPGLVGLDGMLVCKDLLHGFKDMKT